MSGEGVAPGRRGLFFAGSVVRFKENPSHILSWGIWITCDIGAWIESSWRVWAGVAISEPYANEKTETEKAGWKWQIRAGVQRGKRKPCDRKTKMGKWLALEITWVPTDSSLVSLPSIILRHSFVLRITSFLLKFLSNQEGTDSWSSTTCSALQIQNLMKSLTQSYYSFTLARKYEGSEKCPIHPKLNGYQMKNLKFEPKSVQVQG